MKTNHQQALDGLPLAVVALREFFNSLGVPNTRIAELAKVSERTIRNFLSGSDVSLSTLNSLNDASKTLRSSK